MPLGTHFVHPPFNCATWKRQSWGRTLIRMSGWVKPMDGMDTIQDSRCCGPFLSVLLDLGIGSPRPIHHRRYGPCPLHRFPPGGLGRALSGHIHRVRPLSAVTVDQPSGPVGPPLQRWPGSLWKNLPQRGSCDVLWDHPGVLPLGLPQRVRS